MTTPAHRRNALVFSPRAVEHHAIRRVAFWSSAMLAPALTYVALRRRPGAALAAAAGVAAGFGLFRTQLARLFAEEPGFRKLPAVAPLEVREYGALELAVTRLDADLDLALDRGFHRLHAYLTGANDRGEHLSMTAPVLTAPATDGGYELSFVMPRGRSLGSLPHPTDPGVHVRILPPRRVAVLRFSGRFTESNIAHHTHLLDELATRQGLHLVGAPLFAGYDAPITLPPLRRNEIWSVVGTGSLR